ncbi:hypothetical protein J2T55_000833 [Methylohalomonas lacus]|uniref:Peptidase metallopeptidase domain-containing protein n=1 Tax=Methylohalomonas lacus TaxID=398773 RepID=A0AAE3L0N4_9GAMM|nr:matrixin family metalloprotease [Methylohalomonas lacus]MCS3902829.1 hypothetical protein [Methylohalomonas lacus]
MACFLSLAFPLSAHAGEEGYRLLELDGYKVKWGDRRLGVGASVSYAFAVETLRFDDARNCRDLAPIEALLGENLSMETLARETAAAFRVWERAASLSFHEVSDVRDADIVLGAQGRPRGRAFADVSYAPEPEADVRAIEQGLVCLNPDHKWKVGFDGDEDIYDIRYTLIHEIGHAIGLDHPGPSGQVMAFRYTESFDDLQPGDLRGVRRLYGRATDDGGPANGFDTHLADKPTEAYRANNLIGHSLISMTEDKEIESISDFIIDKDGGIVTVIGGFLGIGEKGDALFWDSVELAWDADVGIW